MLVHLARLGLAASQDAPVTTVEALAAIDRFGVHELVDNADHADVILFTQCHLLPNDWRLTSIRDHPLAKRHRDKVMVYDERDRPWCGFPGVYVSMPARAFDHDHQRAFAYFPPARTDFQEAPDLLFSFIGSPSARCRKPLFALKHADAIVEEVRRFTFFDHGSSNFEQQRARFQNVLGRSRFVLCPRGRGTSSIRLFETLAAGRVPVIVADDWVAPTYADWDSFSIRWPERETNGLVQELEERSDNWPAMSAAATTAYRDFFAPNVWFHRLVELCDDLKQSDVQGFPSAGVRNRAFLAAGADFRRWRATSAARRTGRRALRGLGLG